LLNQVADYHLIINSFKYYGIFSISTLKPIFAAAKNTGYKSGSSLTPKKLKGFKGND
jgi:hypothetical protein